jgi:hypothetical protein
MGYFKFETTHQPASILISHPSLRTHVPANQVEVETQRQSEGPTLRERKEEARLKRHIRGLDDTTRHALLETLQSEFLSLNHQEEVSDSFASLAVRFEAEISQQEGWYEELGYVPGEHLEFRSEKYHWKEEPDTQCITVQITGEPTGNNVDIQVRLACLIKVVRLTST